MRNKKNVIGYAVLLAVVAVSGLLVAGFSWKIVIYMLAAGICYAYLEKYKFANEVRGICAYIYGMAGVNFTAGQLAVYQWLPLTLILLVWSLEKTLQKTRYGVCVAVAVLCFSMQGEAFLWLGIVIGIGYLVYQAISSKRDERKIWSAILIVVVSYVSGLLLAAPVWWNEWKYHHNTALTNQYLEENPVAFSGLRQIKTALLRTLSDNLQGNIEDFKGHGDFYTAFPVFLSVVFVLCMAQYLYKKLWCDRKDEKFLVNLLPLAGFLLVCSVYFRPGTYIFASELHTGAILAFLPYFIFVIGNVLDDIWKCKNWNSICNIAVLIMVIGFVSIYGTQNWNGTGKWAFILSISCLVVSAVLLEAMKRMPSQKFRNMGFLCLFVVIAVNLCGDNRIALYQNMEKQAVDEKSYQQILQEIEKQEKNNAYRIGDLTQENHKLKNGAEFSTKNITEGLVEYGEKIGNQGYFDTLQNGISYQKHNMGGYFEASAAQTMGIKYIITKEERNCAGFSLFAHYGEYYAYRCDSVVSLGAVYENTVAQAAYDNYDSAERLVYAENAVVLEDAQTAEKYENTSHMKEIQNTLDLQNSSVENGKTEVRDSGINGECEKQGSVYIPVKETAGEASYLFDTYISLEKKGRIWLSFWNQSGNECETMEYYVDGQKEISAKLPTDAVGIQITFEIANEFKIEFPALYQIMEDNQKKPVALETTSNGYQTTIETQEDGILYLAIPFDSRTKVYIDDMPSQILRANYGLTALELPKGSHKIQVVTAQVSQVANLLLLGTGFLVFAGLCFCIHKHEEVIIAGYICQKLHREQKEDRKGKGWITLIFIVGFVLLFMQHRTLNIFYDDYANAALCYGRTIEGVNGTNYTMNQLLEWAKWCYMNWGGRILYAGLFLIPMLKNGAALYMTVQTVVITILLFLLYRMVCYLTKEKRSIPAALLVWLLYGLIGRDIHVQGTYWASASILYVWPLVPVFFTIFAFLVLVKRIKEERPVNVGMCLPAVLIPAFFAGFSQEQTGLSLVVSLIFIIILAEGKDWKKYNRLNVPVLVVSIGSYALEVAAPGNYVRMDTNEFASLSFVEKIRTNIPVITNMFFENSFLWINLMLIAAMVLMSVSLFKKHGKYRIFAVGTVLNAIVYIAAEKIGFGSVLTLVFEIEFLLYLVVLCTFYFVSSGRSECMALVAGAVASVYCLVLSPAVQFRSYIEYMFVVFLIIAVVFTDTWKAVRKSNLWKAAYSLVIVAVACKSAMMFGTMYIGYTANSYSLAYNHEVLKHYKKGDTSLILSKANNDVYRLQMPYDTGFDYIDGWMREYYDIPDDVEIIWRGCVDYKDITVQDLTATYDYEKNGQFYENGWLGQRGDLILSDKITSLTLLCSGDVQDDEETMLYVEWNGRYYGHKIGQEAKRITIPVERLQENRIHLVAEKTHKAKGSRDDISVRVQIQINR